MNKIEELECKLANFIERLETLEHLDKFNRDLIGDLDLDQIRQDSLRENKIRNISTIEERLDFFEIEIKKIRENIIRIKNTQDIVIKKVNQL